MNEDFEIELLDEESTEEVSFQLPMNFIVLGEVANDDVDVYIRQDVFKKLEEYSASDTEHELGSILVGEFSDVMGKTSVVISEYIEAKYTDASSATLTFTHETWDYIHKEHEKNYADKKILGWQHTHPGYGIFLSNYDMFIQENFFNLPFQVAYVIDPKQGTRGFFQWKDGTVQKLKGFYIYDEVGKPLKVDLAKREAKKDEAVSTNTSKLPKYITIVLSVLVVLLTFAFFNLSSKIKVQSSAMEYLRTVISNQSQMMLETKTVEENDENEMSFIKYTVKRGDTIISICKDNGLDYYSNVNIIKALNGIEDVDKIVVGQTMILPQYN